MMTSSTSPGSTFARSNAALMATWPKACAGMLDSEPLKDPTGVRAALTMTISSSFILRSTSHGTQGHNVVIPAMEAYVGVLLRLAAKPLVLRTKNVLLISQLRHKANLGGRSRRRSDRHVARDAEQERRPVIIKKYANRRLYNTDTSTYVTLEDLAEMVRGERDFVVYDAKTG